jgi:hypothetical protein
VKFGGFFVGCADKLETLELSLAKKKKKPMDPLHLDFDIEKTNSSNNNKKPTPNWQIFHV